MGRVIKREDLTIGRRLVSTANPAKGAKYEVVDVSEAKGKWWQTYTEYSLKCYEDPPGHTGRPVKGGGLTGRTLNHIRRYFALLPNE